MIETKRTDAGAVEHLHMISRAPSETDALGVSLATHLKHGGIVSLDGPLGAGKSHLARAMIRAILNDPLHEVPSPSYTLVNVYDAGQIEIWHADLYRIGDASELDELGLSDRVDARLTIVEWASRWPNLPDTALRIQLAFADEDVRIFELSWPSRLFPGLRRDLGEFR